MEPPRDPDPGAPGDRRWFGLTLFAGGLLLILTLWLSKDRDGLATSDEAAYSAQADSLLADGSLTIDFVRHYHVEYPPEIAHPEDFYPPGNGALLALSQALLGRSEFSNMVPSALFGCLLLPLLAFLLARAIGVSAPFSCAVALAVMFEAEVRDLSTQGLADLPFIFLLLLALLLILRGANHWGALLSGALLAASFYFKPTAILFAPGLALAHWIAVRPRFRRLCLHWTLMGAAFLLVSGPWLVRNQRLFGDPLYSGNKHLSAASLDPDYEYNDIRKVYWADPEYRPADLGGSMLRHGWRPLLTRVLLHLYEAFVLKGREVFNVGFLLAALVFFRQRKVAAILAVVLSFTLALSVVFAVEARYLLPCVPLSLAVIFLLAERVVFALDQRTFLPGTGLEWLAPRPLGRGGGVALLLATLWIYPGAAALTRDLAFGVPSFAPGNEAIPVAADWVERHLPPDAAVMHQQALRFHYYSRRPAVETPFDGPDEIQAVVERYRIGCIIYDPGVSYAKRTREYLDAYFERYGDAWRTVKPEEGDFVVYLPR